MQVERLEVLAVTDRETDTFVAKEDQEDRGPHLRPCRARYRIARSTHRFVRRRPELGSSKRA